jgi:hypothetical protein
MRRSAAVFRNNLPALECQAFTLHLLPALQRATKYKKIMLGRKLLR